MIIDGQIKIYDGESGESVYTLGNYGLGWLVAHVAERDKIVIESVSKSNITYIDSGFNWEHTRKDEI